LRFWLVRLSNSVEGPWPLERLLPGGLAPVLALLLVEPADMSDAAEPRLSFMSRPTDDEVVAVAVAGMAEADGRRYAVGGPPRTQTLVCS
jgi:hypothetical protein